MSNKKEKPKISQEYINALENNTVHRYFHKQFILQTNPVAYYAAKKQDEKYTGPCVSIKKREDKNA